MSNLMKLSPEELMMDASTVSAHVSGGTLLNISSGVDIGRESAISPASVAASLGQSGERSL